MAAETAVISAGLNIASTVIGSLMQWGELQEEEDQQLETYEDTLRYGHETGSDQLKELSASSAHDMRTAAAEGQQVISASKNIAGESGTRNTGTTAATQKQTEVQVAEELARLKGQSDYAQKAAAAEYTFMNEQLEQKISWLDSGTPTTAVEAGGGTDPAERKAGGAAGTDGTGDAENDPEEKAAVADKEKKDPDAVGQAGTGGIYGEGYSDDKTTKTMKTGDKLDKETNKAGTAKTKEAVATKAEAGKAGQTVNADREKDPGSASRNTKTTETATEAKTKADKGAVKEVIRERAEKAEKAEKVKERAERQRVSRESRF